MHCLTLCSANSNPKGSLLVELIYRLLVTPEGCPFVGTILGFCKTIIGALIILSNVICAATCWDFGHSCYFSCKFCKRGYKAFSWKKVFSSCNIVESTNVYEYYQKLDSGYYLLWAQGKPIVFVKDLVHGNKGFCTTGVAEIKLITKPITKPITWH